MILSLTKLLLASLIAASIVYYLACMIAARRFFSGTRAHSRTERPPVTIMIPLRGADTEAYENYASLCCQNYPCYQMVFGVQDPDDSSVAVVRELMKNHPEGDILLVVGLETVGHNPKVNNLHNMLASAKHDCIVVMDSDIRVGPDFLSSVVPELSDERVGLVTCFYKAGKAPNLASKLESVGITGEFAPGVLVAQLGEGMRFSLGAVMATTKEKLRSIGGFHAISDFLADDYMLGNLMWKAGYEIRLSHYVVQTIHPHATLEAMIRHQIRWGRGIRACRPIGHLGSVVTHGTTLALINMVLAGGSLWSILLLIPTAGAQLTMSWVIGVRFLNDAVLRQNIWLLPLRDLLSFGIWCASLVGREVEWRGKRFRLLEKGKMAPVERSAITHQ